VWQWRVCGRGGDLALGRHPGLGTVVEARVDRRRSELTIAREDSSRSRCLPTSCRDKAFAANLRKLLRLNRVTPGDVS
jgi:hypothetical protein